MKNMIKKFVLMVTFVALVVSIFWLPEKKLEIDVVRTTSIVILAALGYFCCRAVFSPVTKLEYGKEEIEKAKLEADELRRSHRRLQEKVRKHTAELSADNSKLEAEIENLPLDQRQLRRHIKQLNCLYGLSKLINQRQISLEQIFQETPNLIRNAYQYPDITCVRITLEGVQYKTDNFKKSELSQYAKINVSQEKAGGIEVYYLAEKAESDKGPFLQEEHALLDAVAKHLGRTVESKKSAQTLRLFRDLIDRSNDCIFVIEPKWGRFIDLNDRACVSLGYTREELLEMTVKDIEESIPDDSSWRDKAEELKLKPDLVIRGRHRRKDATTFYVETSLKYVSQENEDHIIAVARDITERKRAEERQAQLLQEVKSVNKELKDFAYIVSHDLKAPLRGIKTLTDWLATDYADKLDENGKEQLNLLLNRVQRMHNLIDGVLKYSRVGRVKEEKVKVDLNGLVSEVIDMVAPPENIEITVENKLPVVECEQIRIMQVFQNLLSNAVKYMDKPKGQVRIGCVEEDSFWNFSISDNGPGIEEKYFEKIFQMFQTLTPRDEFESTGIGLTVVKKIIEMYGGRILVESEVGNGTTFFFTLPKGNLVVKDEKLEANIAC
ncbi:MAG: ATP-binding protein [Phycisphaerae bacterium]|nr:ATP-binding protein [Phycisphaerae bacterium]